MSASLRRELVTTPILFVVLVVLRLFPYSLIATLWNGQTFDSALTGYRTMFQEKLLEAIIWSTIFVVLMRIVTWFERRPKVPHYGDRDDGYKVNRHG
ncbi:hypothetical protein CAP40_12490 [Sphingomonas sp. IBVSS2]|nr:hypothetical protein CAP40_12490 [Sphingomonas sp. IBVSS2]